MVSSSPMLATFSLAISARRLEVATPVWARSVAFSLKVSKKSIVVTSLYGFPFAVLIVSHFPTWRKQRGEDLIFFLNLLYPALRVEGHTLKLTAVSPFSSMPNS